MMSAAEYLAWEREQDGKHEFYDGEVFAMSGGSIRHAALGAGVGAVLRAAFSGRPCTTFSSELKIGLGGRYVYPDASVVCGPPVTEANARDVVTNPAVIVEILSKTTGDYDRGKKWESYQRLASLTDYLLVAQDGVRIEQFRRDGIGWHYQAFGPGERITLAGGITLEVDSIYAGVFELPGGDD